MKKLNYKIIHKDSPDNRGIDVAFLYNPDYFNPLRYNCFPLTDKNGKVIPTREILYVLGTFGGSDTIHFFINHWPSRYSGLLRSRGLRILAATILRTQVEKLLDQYIDPQIIIMGDFNDQPDDLSIVKYLKALPYENNISANSVYNLSAGWKEGDKGTTKFRAQWYIFDQIIVSGKLLDHRSGLYVERGSAKIADMPFLFEPDDRYGGVKPLRTYYGYTYQGGFSDHLPVVIQLKVMP